MKLAAIRRQAPDILATARTQRWAPDEILRVLVDAEIAARDASNTRNRMAAARFPVDKTLDEFRLDESSIPTASNDYLVTLEWIHQAENLCLVGPAGTGKTHYLIGLGRAAVTAGYKVRYFTAVDLVEHLYRAVADNTVGKAIEAVCRNDLIIIDEIGFAPSTTPAANSCSGSSPPATNAAPSPSAHTHRSTTGAASCPTNPPPSRCSTGSATTPTSSPPPATATGSPTAPPAREAGPRGLSLATSEDFGWPPARTTTWPLTRSERDLTNYRPNGALATNSSDSPRYHRYGRGGVLFVEPHVGGNHVATSCRRPTRSGAVLDVAGGSCGRRLERRNRC